MIDLAEAKRFLRVNYDDDDSVIEMLLNASEGFLRAAVGESVDLEDPRAKTVMLMHLSDLYTNRTMEGKGTGYSLSISNLLMQLRLELEEDEDDDTGRFE